MFLCQKKKMPDPILVRDSFLDRSRQFLGLHLLCVVALNCIAAAVTFFSQGQDRFHVAGISVRLLGTAILAGFYCLKWSKPSSAYARKEAPDTARARRAAPERDS